MSQIRSLGNREQIRYTRKHWEKIRYTWTQGIDKVPLGTGKR